MSRLARRWRAAVVAAALVVACLTPATAAHAANGSLVQLPRPVGSADDWRIRVADDCFDVKVSCSYRDSAAAGPRDLWAVGDRVDDGTGSAALVRHWDGHQWATVEPAVPGTLTSVSSKSADQTWMAGYTTEGSRLVPTSLRWNGDELQQLQVPAGRSNTTVAGVSVGKGSPWMVGTSDNGDRTYRDLVWRWTGKAWRQVPIPDLSTGPGGVVDVAAIDDDDVWVAGDRGGNGGHYVQHWDGTGWTTQQLPALGGKKYVSDIQSVYGEIYVIGDRTTDANPYQERPFVQKLVGNTWRNAASPDYHGTLTSIARDGKGGLWFGGDDYEAGVGRLDRWNGQRMRQVAAPEGELASLTNPRGTTRLWVTGGRAGDAGRYQALVAEYLR